MSQITLESSPVIHHLLWHKAMLDQDEDSKRINELLSLVQAEENAEHFAIRRPFERDIALTMELVTKAGLDPWDIDLASFAKIYLEEAKKRGVDLVTAGKVVLMAWTVLRLQSDEVARAATEYNNEEELGWDDVPQWDMDDDDWDFNEMVRLAPNAPIEEKIRHKGDRRVTLMELIGAFEDVHREAEDRSLKQSAQAKARVDMGTKLRGKVRGMMHTEDLQAEVAETLQRILDYGETVVPFSAIHTGFKIDLVQCFTGILFLARDQKVTLEQPDFPHGDILIQIKVPEAVAA